jgi:DNA-binding CsgD family transcriptional regulator
MEQPDIAAIKALLFESIGDDQLVKKFVQAVHTLTGSTSTNFSIFVAPRFDMERLVTEPETNPERLKAIPFANQYVHEQPMLKHFLENKSVVSYVKITDFMTTDAFRETNIYQLGYKLLGFDHMMAAGAWDNHGRLYTLVITHPERDLTEENRSQLRSVFPVFLKAFAIQNRLAQDASFMRNVLSLTEKQKIIMTWVGHGKNNQEIAIILGKHPKTIEKHVRGICEKMGFSKRSELLDFCLKQRRVAFPTLGF